QAHPVEGEQRGVGLGLDRRRALRAVEEAHLAEEVGGAHVIEHLLDAAPDGLGDENGALADDEHLVAGIAFAEEELVLAQAPLVEALRERDQLRLREPGEEADVPQDAQEIGGGPPPAPPPRPRGPGAGADGCGTVAPPPLGRAWRTAAPPADGP